MNSLRPFIDGIFSLIFWLWNLVFLAAVYAGLLPFLAFPLAQAVLNGEVEPEFLVILMLLLLVPGMSVFLGWTKFRQQPSQLLGLFYGVEAPLMLALTLRLFVLRELTPASTLVVGTSIVCMMAFLLEMLFGYARDNKWLARLQLGVHSVMFLGSLSVAAILMFYAVPVAWTLLREFFRFAWLESLWWMLTNYPFGFMTQGLTFMMLVGLTASLFVAMPWHWQCSTAFLGCALPPSLANSTATNALDKGRSPLRQPGCWC
ncbi:MAG: hypothetical protein HC925_04550 [Coleofasciculaceae cyanobacterium SM2_3_26]|nr:hypothetical protein [Coleofasciculaceae cyanobacterium SM2_3_26]